MPPAHRPACTITIKGDPPPLLLLAELLQVSDFNLSRLMEESQAASSMAAGNPRWLAPEVLEGRGATLAAVSLGEEGACGGSHKARALSGEGSALKAGCCRAMLVGYGRPGSAETSQGSCRGG
jgi:hypothetical protein